MKENEGISIWFFIGSLLLVYGVLITGAEVWAISHPPEHPPVLFELHAGVWWGILLGVLGLVYCIKFNPRRSR